MFTSVAATGTRTWRMENLTHMKLLGKFQYSGSLFNEFVELCLKALRKKSNKRGITRKTTLRKTNAAIEWTEMTLANPF